MKENEDIKCSLLTIKQLATYLGINRNTITRLQKKEGFPKPVFVMTQKKWRRSDIDAYLESTKAKE